MSSLQKPWVSRPQNEILLMSLANEYNIKVHQSSFNVTKQNHVVLTIRTALKEAASESLSFSTKNREDWFISIPTIHTIASTKERTRESFAKLRILWRKKLKEIYVPMSPGILWMSKNVSKMNTRHFSVTINAIIHTSQSTIKTIIHISIPCTFPQICLNCKRVFKISLFKGN